MGNVWKENQKKILTVCAAGIGIYVGFRYLFPLLSPFLLAFCIVYLLNPWLNRMQKRTHIKKEVLLALVLVLAAVLVLGLLAALLQYAAGEAGTLVENWDGISRQVGGQIEVFFGDCCMFVEEHFGLDAGKVEQVVLERVEVFIEELRVELVPNLMKESWWYVRKLISAAAFLGVGFIASLLLCRDYDSLMRNFGQNGGRERERDDGGKWKTDSAKKPESRLLTAVLAAAERILSLVLEYVKAQALILLVIMAIASAGLWLGKVGNAFVLGFFAGILDALPFIGTGVILLPTALWQLICGRAGTALWCLAVYICCVGARELLEPKLMGKRTGVYPVFMLLSVYAGVKLFGLSGILKGPLSLVVLMELFRKKEEAPEDASDGENEQG
ncbi:MAG TPA: AI-2E family transporter [Candidatus Eisenbergiella stercoravium]|nr:AI-2E family transporter [Candidatus Eisenbergiella stercoravium]